jgi:Flp pilus assembly protein TadG
MGYDLMGLAHATWLRMRDERGQGTVEYVGLILLLAIVLAGVVKAAHGFSDSQSIAHTVVDKLKKAIGTAAGDKAT